MLGIVCTVPAFSQTVTYSEDIAPIIYSRCTNCHRAGEIGPMPFTNYSEVSAWGGMVSYVTEIKYMPPWKPNPEFSKLLGENYLTDAEIDLIKQWVAQGMPQGDPSLEPPLPVFPTGSQVGQPDLVLSFTEAHLHPGTGVDEYRFFVLPTGLTQEKYLKALEVRPGNLKAVHHTLCWQDTAGIGAANDAATPEYGYEGFAGQFGLDNQLPGYVPGQKPRKYPDGLAQKLKPNADIILQMHYAPSSIDMVDSSSVYLFFADSAETITRYVSSKVMLPFAGTLTNGPFIIQPNEIKRFHGVYEVPANVSLLGIAPHMHLLGQDWEVVLITPSGDTVNLIKIDEWDFNWQGGYTFPGFIKAEAGSEIHAWATYDNTANNPLNPNNPPKTISWGEKTTDEMYYLPIMYVPYQAGDENIVFEDDNITSVASNVNLKLPESKLYPVYPNPAKGNITAAFSLSSQQTVRLQVIDMTGKVVLQVTEGSQYGMGNHKVDLDINNLTPGNYMLSLTVPGMQSTQKFVVTE